MGLFSGVDPFSIGMELASMFGGNREAKRAQHIADAQYSQYGKPEMDAKLALMKQLEPLLMAMQNGDQTQLPDWLKTPQGAYDLPIQELRTQRLGQLHADLAGRGLMTPGMTSSAEIGGLAGLENWQTGARVDAQRQNTSDTMARLGQLYNMFGSTSNQGAAQNWNQVYQGQANNANNSTASGLAALGQLYGTLQAYKGQQTPGGVTPSTVVGGNNNFNPGWNVGSPNVDQWGGYQLGGNVDPYANAAKLNPYASGKKNLNLFN